MFFRIKQYLLLIVCFLVSSCTFQKSVKEIEIRTVEMPSVPTTFFVHGTYLPVVTPMLHLECKPGVTQCHEYKDTYLLPKIGKILHQTDEMRFPLDTFYLFGWSGQLNVNERKKAAEELYESLRMHEHPITLICHSHGCNVALNLAAIAEEKKDTDFFIDSLILLAGPVQEATKEYIKSPIFKKIVSFYSEGDVVQVIDPQGLQKKKPVKKIFKEPLFSKRLWPHDDKLVQVKVLFGRNDPWHMDFVLEKFMKVLAEALNKIDEISKNSSNKYYTLHVNRKSHIIDLIPDIGKNETRK